MTAYTPDPTSHVLDANLASNPQRMLSGGKTGSRHAQGSHRLGRAVSLWRLWLLGLGFLTLFTIIGAKIVHLAVLAEGREPVPTITAKLDTGAQEFRRSQLTDRNGRLLSDNVYRKAAYAVPAKIVDLDGTIDGLAQIFPELDVGRLRADLNSNKSFVYIKRRLTPDQEAAVFNLGEPGLNFLEEQYRVYPHGNLTSHIVGFNDIDTFGQAGVEAYFDETLKEGLNPIALSIDVRVQHIVAEELAATIQEFNAIAGTAVLLDSNTGEVIALVSLPDFDPYNPATQSEAQRLNRATYGNYELGSVFKVFTLASAIEADVVRLDEMIDVSKPIRVGGHKISDYKRYEDQMNPRDILRRSSNIGASKLALRVGSEAQESFLRDLRLLSPSTLEIQETSTPEYPARWGKASTATISYGYGVAASPLQIANAFSTMVNGGVFRPATLVRQPEGQTLTTGHRVISEQTSATMRDMLEYVVREGTGRFAAAEGYRVGGKTGTANIARGGGYNEDARRATFLGAFPINDPKYTLLVMVENPDPEAQEYTYGYATGGWVAAPAFRRIVERAAPMLGLEPQPDPEDGDALASR